MAITNLTVQIGRRKTAVARVYLREGNGEIIVNGKKLGDYFCGPTLEKIVTSPLETTDNLDKFNLLITVKGGGYNGQADACKLGIARALCEYDPSNRPSLKAAGFLTRDARAVERKKYGQRGARKRFQFSKR